MSAFKPIQEDEDLYEGFNNDTFGLQQAQQYSQFDQPVSGSFGKAGPTAYAGGGSAGISVASSSAAMAAALLGQQRQGTAQRRMPTQGGRSVASDAPSERPMTSVRAAGYTSSGKGGPAPLRDSNAAAGPAPPLAVCEDASPEQQAREFEKKLNNLIEESAKLNAAGKFTAALEKAKEAEKKEKALRKHREHHHIEDQANMDLQYSVELNKAVQQEACEMYAEAIKTYSEIVKNKNYAAANRLRVNMGNIYFKQSKFPSAIKMYRMALDTIKPGHAGGQQVRAKIMRNIGISFLKIGQYTEAVRAFEEVMKTHGDSVTGLNLVACYFALGERDAMRESFIKLIHSADAHQNDDDLDEGITLEDKAVGKEEDELHVALKTKRSQARRVIMRAAKLIAPKIAQDEVQGYEFLIEQLRAAQLADIAGEMEVSKAVHYLKSKELDKARDTLRELEKREEKEQDPATRSRAATNLAFISLLLDDVKGATEYGNIAVRCDRYNARGLVNRGNVEFANALQARRKGSDRDFVDACEHALQLYQEAVDAEHDCSEAVYNSAIVNRHLGRLPECRGLLQRYLKLAPGSPDAMFQLAQVCDAMRDAVPKDKPSAAQLQQLDALAHESSRLYKDVTREVPCDPSANSRYAQHLQSVEQEDGEAFHYMGEAHKHFPVDLDVVSWLGAYYVKSEMYEEAMAYFVRASYIQPKEKKWKLMVASCHRRVGASQQALQVYEAVEKEYPEDLECLTYLQRICSDLGMMERASRYSELLAKAERKADKLRAEALGAGGAFKAADQEADSVSMGDGGFLGAQQARQGGVDAQARGLDHRKVSVTALEASSGASGMRVASGKQLDESDDWGNDMGALLPT